MPFTPPTRDQIVTSARSYIGTPFKMRGRDRRGVDCVGLLYLVSRDCGYQFQDFTDYDRGAEPVKMAAFLNEYGDEIRPFGNFKPGQVLKLRQSWLPMHLGLVARGPNGLTVINASMRKRAVVEDPMAEWADMILAQFEFKGVQ